MIFLCGIPSETPLRLIANRLEAEGANYVTFNQREFADCDIVLDIVAGHAAGGHEVAQVDAPALRVLGCFGADAFSESCNFSRAGRAKIALS